MIELSEYQVFARASRASPIRLQKSERLLPCRWINCSLQFLAFQDNIDTAGFVSSERPIRTIATKHVDEIMRSTADER